jgi:hypothetical protein
VKISSGIALTLCCLRAAFWLFLIFVMPDPVCFRWGAVDYAALCLAIYSILLTIVAVTIPKAPRLTVVVLALSVVGIWASYLIWDLPQTRVACDGTVWPAGNVR